MTIIAIEDTDQTDKSERSRLAVCPRCGQKLVEIESLYRRGVFRQKCRRCKRYIRITAINNDTTAR